METNTILSIQIQQLLNMLTANYEISRGLRSLLGCQTTSYLVLTNVKKKIKFLFLVSFLNIAAADNVLTRFSMYFTPKFVSFALQCQRIP